MHLELKKCNYNEEQGKLGIQRKICNIICNWESGYMSCNNCKSITKCKCISITYLKHTSYRIQTKQ